MSVIVVKRKKLSFWERTYIPQILSGMWITLKGFFSKKVTLQYPDETPPLPRRYRGAPVLVCDSEGRKKCVACQMCEFVCPPKAIKVIPAEIKDTNYSFIEKAPARFEIDMTRCIFCGMCEEVCPESAIILSKEFSVTFCEKEKFLRDKDTLFAKGGTMPDKIKKWRTIKDKTELEGLK